MTFKKTLMSALIIQLTGENDDDDDGFDNRVMRLVRPLNILFVKWNSSQSES